MGENNEEHGRKKLCFPGVRSLFRNEKQADERQHLKKPKKIENKYSER
jgi:hypothetical protein